MPAIIACSISILSDAGLGMAMYSLGKTRKPYYNLSDRDRFNCCFRVGLFMALQPRMIACGNTVAAFAMAVRFLTGPAVMAAVSIEVGL